MKKGMDEFLTVWLIYGWAEERNEGDLQPCQYISPVLGWEYMAWIQELAVKVTDRQQNHTDLAAQMQCPVLLCHYIWYTGAYQIQCMHRFQLPKPSFLAKNHPFICSLKSPLCLKVSGILSMQVIVKIFGNETMQYSLKPLEESGMVLGM